MSRIDDDLHGSEAPEPLLTRLQAARARLAQLRGWQQWAGSHARDELVLQAQALAIATIGGAAEAAPSGATEGGEAADASAVADSEAVESGADPSSEAVLEQARREAAAEVARLSLRQRAEVIDTLRARWKELDRVGSPGGQALWRRFDAALKQAYEPVAAQAAAQRAARHANLAARLQLLETLDALQLADAPEPASGAAPGADADAGTNLERDTDAGAGVGADGQPPAERPVPADARRLADALARFHAEWRKLGPVQHTVPRAEQAALSARLQAALERTEAPLQAARSRARAERAALVARARALVAEAPQRGREVVDEVRALQAEWQQHARSLPLARADEQALWNDFKAATDAVFAARQATFDAREAEFEAHASERMALIDRLRVNPDDSPATQRRTLAEVDAAWQRCGPAPRARAAALDQAYRAARDALVQWLDQAAQRDWQAGCDALDAKLALCRAREEAASAGAMSEGRDGSATLAETWHALPALPAPFEDALRRRAGLAAASDADRSPPVDDLLLQIETAWDLPTPPPFEAARRERKLLAMKAALEGRRGSPADALTPEAALARLLGRGGLDAGQGERLAQVLARWRQQGSKRRG